MQGIDEGWQQVFAVSQQHHIEEGGEGFGIGGKHRPTAEHDRVIIRSLITPDGNSLLFQEIQQHGSIELPAQGKAEQFTAAVLGIALVGEQSTHVQVRTHGQGGPDDLVPEAGDADGVGAGKSQHRAQGASFRHSRIKQQGFLIQDSFGGLGDFGGGGAVKARLRIDPSQA